MKYVYVLAIFMMAATAVRVAHADVFGEGVDYSTTTIERKFWTVTNLDDDECNERDGPVGDLAITIVPADKSSVTEATLYMTPPNYLNYDISFRELYLTLNSEYSDYSGPAGAYLVVPKESLEEVSFGLGAVVHVLRGVWKYKHTAEVNVHTQAMAYVEDLESEGLDVDATTGATAVVLFGKNSREYDVESDEISTGATVFVSGADDIELDDVTTQASAYFVGGSVYDVEIDELSTGAVALFEFEKKNEGLEIDDLNSSGELILIDCDDLDVDDAWYGIITTNTDSNCDDVSKLVRSSRSVLTCNVVDADDIEVPSIPDAPTELVKDVSPSSTSVCSAY